MSRPSTYHRPTNLSIRPPSPSHPTVPSLSTPTTLTNPYGNAYSPRKTALPPSPTHSNVSYASRGSSSGVGTRGEEVPPPLPIKSDKKLPGIPGIQGQSPHKYSIGGGGTGTISGNHGGNHGQKGWVTGVYDNKLVSSTLSHLPPLPPVSPVHASSSSTSLHPTNSSSHLHPSPRPSVSGSTHNHNHNHNQLQSSGIVVYPDGTPLTEHNSNYYLHHHHHDPVGRIAESMAMAHSSPNSPWSLLTVHVLPLFAGSALKTPLEDLNQLCHSHIVSTSQRSPPSRIVSLLTSDLREFIASGMLTLKAKFETLEEGKVVSRAAEVWIFFWAQVLPYVEGVFLPFTQLRDLPSSNSTSNYLTALSSPIPVRHLLLSGFLIHILLPLLPRLIPQIVNPAASSPLPNSYPPPTTLELNKILQMSLVLSTQARYSTFISTSSSSSNEEQDEEVRFDVESLGKAVRWKIQQNENEVQQALSNNNSSPVKTSSVPSGIGRSNSGGGGLNRGPSLSQSGRYRRKGWRASANLGLLGVQQFQPPAGTGEISRQNSSDHFANLNMKNGRIDEDDEENGYYEGRSHYPPRHRTNTNDSMNTLGIPNNGGIGSSMLSSTTNGGASTLGTGSTMTGGSSTITGGASTIRGESLASYGESPTATPTTSTASGQYMTKGIANPNGDYMYGRPIRRGRAESDSEVIGARGDRRI
ncbi:uncharacterized protein IL334_005606 [Kwoniella shivajii]|uniref:HbrB-like protein n=1 Tax=Kwoniella shivajii TaxID=564305 RepID=A0ABZ1D3Y0_9TREE|nr:hypothetical protein IL334_005606 [Kwoniella shivajii]